MMPGKKCLERDMKLNKHNLCGWFILIFAFWLLIMCCGCALKMNDITKVHPDGTKEIDKSFHLGSNDFSPGKEINFIKIN